MRIEKITEEISDEAATVTLQARPMANPLSEDTSTAHFFYV